MLGNLPPSNMKGYLIASDALIQFVHCAMNESGKPNSLTDPDATLRKPSDKESLSLFHSLSYSPIVGLSANPQRIGRRSAGEAI